MSTYRTIDVLFRLAGNLQGPWSFDSICEYSYRNPPNSTKPEPDVHHGLSDVNTTDLPSLPSAIKESLAVCPQCVSFSQSSIDLSQSLGRIDFGSLLSDMLDFMFAPEVLYWRSPRLASGSPRSSVASSTLVQMYILICISFYDSFWFENRTLISRIIVRVELTSNMDIPLLSILI